RADGMDARLTIIGCNPRAIAHEPGVTIHAYLDKGVPRDVQCLEELLNKAHLLLLPTRADCTPMVIAEANAHSVTVVARVVGGMTSILSPGSNGQLLPLDADGTAWADAIRRIVGEPDAYRALRESSFAFYRNRLNWTAWCNDLIADLA